MGGAPVRVVIVDDAPEVRDVVRLQLRLSGRFEIVGEGATGREAVALASEHRPDLMLLDASMPDMDGLEAIPRVREASPATQVVMLTGFEADSLRTKALALGAADFVEKSRPIRELPARLLALLGDADDLHAPSGVDAPQAEDVMAEHLERFRTVFEQAAIGMATLTLAGSIVRTNRALAWLVGQQESDVVGRPFSDLGRPEYRAALAEAVARAAGRTIGAQEIDHQLVVPGPDIRWAHSTVAAVHDVHGRPLYLFAQVEDITRRHQALEELRASEERFRLMVESVQDYAIFMLDPEGHVSTWNLGAERMKRYRADEIIGRHFRTFYPEEAQAAAHPEYELEIAYREGRYEEEGWRVRKDGTQFWANVVITALFDSAGRHLGFAKVTRDMTERRMAQQEREEFLALTAHELQSPVTAISGAADILVEYWDRLAPAERLETLQRIVSGGGRIRRLLNDLLTASRLEAGSFDLTPEPVSVDSVIAQALAEVAGVASGVEVAGGKGLVVQADASRVVQILTNLLINAAKYGKPPIVVHITSAGDAAEIRVRDSGPGLAEEDAARLFDKFARGEGSGNRGTGLGLFIVRELARAHGGEAWFEPVEGGSCFAVRLPLSALS